MSTDVPPRLRSVAGAALAGLAVDGALRLQRCTECGAAQYPPRERCGSCLGDVLHVAVVASGATVLAATTLHHSLEPWFAARTPWTVASLALDAGPVAFAHIEPALARPDTRVRVATARDAGGSWCLVAFADDDRDADTALRHALQSLGIAT